MERICDTPLIEFDIYHVFEIKDLRKKIREMEEIAATKILEMYKEIITYVIIVYEGFEAYITQVCFCYQYNRILVIRSPLPVSFNRHIYIIQITRRKSKIHKLSLYYI